LKGVEKHLKEQIDHFMASVSKTESLPKDNTLELENFNYNDGSSKTKKLAAHLSTLHIDNIL
jgi:hypothetical protein